MRRHKRTVRCVAAPAPRVDFQDFLHENWANLLHKRTVHRDKLSHDLREFIHENWTAVRRHVVKGLATVDLKEKVEKSAESELWQELYDKLSHDLQDFIHENWAAVHKHVIKGLVTGFARILDREFRLGK